MKEKQTFPKVEVQTIPWAPEDPTGETLSYASDFRDRLYADSDTQLDESLLSSDGAPSWGMHNSGLHDEKSGIDEATGLADQDVKDWEDAGLVIVDVGDEEDEAEKWLIRNDPDHPRYDPNYGDAEE